MLKEPEGTFPFHDYSGETTTLGIMVGFNDLRDVLKLKWFYSSTKNDSKKST